MNRPAITILMPAYNAEKYIADAIRSVLEQTFTDFELLIINDGSTDNTVAAIQKFNDPRIRLIECDHRGVSPSLNHGLCEARGFYIARFDADDICYSERLRIQYDFMQANPDYILIGSEEDYIDVNSEYIFTSKYQAYSDAEIRRLDYSVCPFSHVSVMYKKDEVIKAGGYDIHAYTFEDHLLWLNLIKKGKVCNLRQPLVKYRFSPGSVTIDEKWRGRRFRKLKRDILRRAVVTKKEGEKLLAIIKSQDGQKFKEGAYYALCGKKFLLNNHQPARARKYLVKAILSFPLRFDNYALYVLSFFPQPLINRLHRKK